VDVLPVDRGYERAVQTLDDAARLPVADVLHVLDRLGPADVRRIGGQHLLEGPGADLDLMGECDEVVEELLLSGEQTESEHGHLGRRGS
jgi:hypothetical protein